MNIWVIIPAAGIGSRMQSTKPKQYLKLADKTVLEHSVACFDSLDEVKQIVVCLNPSDQYWDSISAGVSAKVVATEGGASRAESVMNGLSKLEGLVAEGDWVMVHDAARPCLSAKALERLIEQVSDSKVGGILATPIRDTLKQSNTDGTISQTLDRSVVWSAQTPQMFRFDILFKALQTGLAEGRAITDEASAIEMMGLSVRLVEGEARNLKITTPDDLLLAEFWMSR
jgi:2-C-methyl-D-erythritol 4-phosphate cytidylyltransferase